MVGGFSVIMNLCVDLCFKLYSPPPVRGEHPPDLLLAVQGAGVLRHEGGGAQAEAQVQGGHPLQGAAVRGAADSVPRGAWSLSAAPPPPHPHPQVGEGLVDVVRGEEGPPGGVPHHQLVVRLARGVQQLQLHPRQLQLQLLGEGLGGGDQAGELAQLQPGGTQSE